ncbi:MAG: hypothetical protein WC796_03975 [Candidatus Pacearchaeota archaeon]|jgi:hypothetical protein
MIYREATAPKDYYTDLRTAIEKDEANQPLGILVAELADQLGLPVVLATSTHHHDSLTHPIIAYSEYKWPLIDCGQNSPNEKATPEFWSRVLNCLEEKLK